MNKIQKFVKIFPAIVVVVMLLNMTLPFTVYAQDVATPTETPSAPVIVDTPTEIPPEIPTETPTDVAPVVDPTQVAEVILTEVPAGTDLVVVDTTGDSIPLDSQDATQIIAAVDPMWCPEDALPNDPSCTTNMSTTDLLADMRANPDKYASSGVIYFNNTAPVTSSFALNDSTDSLGIAYNALNSFNLSMFGGWNGGSTNTFTGQTEFNGSNAFISIGSLANPWLGSVALNNIRVSGNQTQSSGIEINASNVDLTNVDSTYNAGNGITVNADQPGTVNLNNVTTTNNGEGIPGSTSSGVVINGNDTNVNVNGGNFDNNAGFGIDANNSNSTSIPQGNAWTDALDYAPGSMVTLSGNDNRLNGQNQGFTPGETVHVVVSGPNGYSTECDGVADATGEWSCQIQLWASDLAVGDYTYTANGISSGVRVVGNFTDGRTINWVKLNGGSSVTVLPDASITVSMNVTTSGTDSGVRWESSQWSIGPNSWGTYTCVDTDDFTVAGTNTTNFTIPAPSAVGTYNAYFYAWSGARCDSGNSNRFDLPSGIVVVSKTTPAITFGAAPTPTYLGGNFIVNATTTNTDSSTLTYSYVSGPCAWVSDTTFSSSGAGACVVKANGAETTNFYAATQTQNVTIAKATPVITFGTAPTPTYPGSDFSVSANTTNTDSSALTYSYVSGPCAFVSGSTFSSTGSGDCVVQASGAATTNFEATSNTLTITISGKTAPTITWSNPADISYGTALSATRLNATASVPGTFVYTPDSGTVLDAGNSQTLHVDFTPTDTSLYSIASKDVSINVLKADATCTISGFTGAYDGATHGASGLCTGTGSLDLGDTFTNYPGGTAHWTYSGGTNYNDQSGSVVIDISKADATCTIDGYTGIYDGAAHGAGGSCSGTGSLDLDSTYIDFPGGTANWTYTGGINFNDQDGSVFIDIIKADASCTVTPYSVTYDGGSHTATGSCTGVGGPSDILSGLDLSGTTHTDAGIYDDTWTFSDVTGNYNGTGDMVGDFINPADATCTIHGYTGTYDGTSHGATGSCTGISGADLSGSLDLGDTFKNIPGDIAFWYFNDGSGNYSDQNGDVIIEIDPAEANCTVTPYSVTYDGSSHTATGSCTGVGGPSDILSGLDLSGTTHTNANTYTDIWTFSDVTGNYNNTGDMVSNIINPADATCTINGYTGTYDGAAHGATGSCFGTGILDLGLTFTEYPGGTAHWTYSGGTNYNDQSGSVAIMVNKATSTVTVTCPSVSQTYTGLAHTPCSAEATGMGMIALDVSGSLLYADNTNVGTATVSASWGGESNHTGNTGSGSFSISQAAGSVSINNIPVSAEYGGNFTPTFNLLGDGTPSVASLTSGICTMTSGVVNYVGVGTCTLQASVTTGTNYLAATAAPQSFTVVDTTTPVLTLPANIILVAAGPLGATVNYVATALDQVDGAVPVNCVPASGSTFAIGTTTVNCSASDSHENINSGSFTITVQPRGTTTPPIFPPPQPTLLIPVTGGQPVNLVYGSWSTLRTPHGIKVEFLSVLCGYQVSLAEEQAETLPGTLNGTFHHGVTLQILANNNPLDLVPENTFVRISFPMPENSKTEDYSVLFWNADLNNGIGGWMELPLTTGKLNPDNNLDVRQVLSGLQIVNGFAQITVNFPGTFVIVKK